MNYHLIMPYLFGMVLILALTLGRDVKAASEYCTNYGDGRIVCNTYHIDKDMESTYYTTYSSNRTYVNRYGDENE